MAAVMRAVMVNEHGSPEVMKVQSVPIPENHSDQVLVRVVFAGVNPVDAYIREGKFGKGQHLPYTPGKDGAGYVAKVGQGVSHVKAGDAVWFCSVLGNSRYGSYAEFAVLNKDCVWKLPLDLLDKDAFRIGASIGVPYLTAHRALLIKGKCCAGQTVLVHGGTGSVGQACIQIAKKEGLRVAATAGNASGKEFLRSLDLNYIYDHNEKNVADIKADFPEGFDYIIEMRADLNLDLDSSLVGRNGKILVVGNRGPTKLDARQLMSTEASITGVALSQSSQEEWQSGALYVEEGLTTGWLRPRIAGEFKLEEAPTAHTNLIEAQHGAKGKLVLKLNS